MGLSMHTRPLAGGRLRSTETGSLSYDGSTIYMMEELLCGLNCLDCRMQVPSEEERMCNIFKPTFQWSSVYAFSQVQLQIG